MGDCSRAPLLCLDGHVYNKHKRPVGHKQANINPGMLPLACLLVVTLEGIQADFHRFWL